jgi:hypothetical protein
VPQREHHLTAHPQRSSAWRIYALRKYNTSLECADLSALCRARSAKVDESADKSAHSKRRPAIRCVIFSSFALFMLASTRHMIRPLLATLTLVFACLVVFAQQTNPVDRKVANPMTDTPNVNPLNTDQPVPRRPAPQNGVQPTATTNSTSRLPSRARRDRTMRASSITTETSTLASAPIVSRRTR